MDMTFKLQVFEGPLDLLLYLIEKNKVNIYDIPIVEITAQYMEYVNQMKKDNLDTLSEFLVMAATLLDIKSKMLLPKKEEEEQEQEDPRAELVQQLLEYKMYKCMANELKDRQLDAGKIDVTAKSKGKGYAGGLKRHGLKSGPSGHGSKYHRHAGSNGSATTPGRVFKGKKMPGHMGSVRVTIQNLEVVKIDVENNVILVKGAVPGPKKSLVMIKDTVKSGK